METVKLCETRLAPGSVLVDVDGKAMIRGRIKLRERPKIFSSSGSHPGPLARNLALEESATSSGITLVYMQRLRW